MTEVQKNGPQYLRERDKARVEADDLRKQLESLNAEVRMKSTEIARMISVETELRAEVERLREALTDVLASAFPHPKEHPTMYAAWKKAQDALTQRGGR